ncbi:MAG TPA: protein-disulfide reductase DsbD N-terminal domain-containing protein, partial [Methylococcaceae bacterium]|nr:protein-disulfide reductase DsbD N-terminal domain-containing protein [Methylococcaceae bacterium]
MANTRISGLIFLPFLLCFAGMACAIDSAELLPQEQAYRFAAKTETADRALLSWDIAKGYHLYRSKFKFVAKTPGVSLGEPTFPIGEWT